MKRFEDKGLSLVTGAGSGIGAACVRRLYSQKARRSPLPTCGRKRSIRSYPKSGTAKGSTPPALRFRTGSRWPRPCPERFDGSENSMG